MYDECHKCKVRPALPDLGVVADREPFLWEPNPPTLPICGDCLATLRRRGPDRPWEDERVDPVSA